MRLTGRDGPREVPVTRAEARRALRSFIKNRLPAFGPQQDAMLAADPVMAHSLLSPALNLGLLDPVECAQAAEDAYRAGDAPLASVEGFVRQLIGWRDYVWHLYWHFGEDYINRMSDYCGPCPFTAGYWSFLDRHADRFANHPRMARQVKGAARLDDLRQVVAQEKDRGSRPP